MQEKLNRLLIHYELGVSPPHVQRLAGIGVIPEIGISKMVRRYCLSAVLAALNEEQA